MGFSMREIYTVNMLIFFQIFFVLFALIALGAVIGRRKANQLDVKGTVFWILFWIAAGIVVIWPSTTQRLAGHLGIGRGTDVVLYISVALLFYMLFRLQVKIEEINRDVTKVVRDKALKEVKKQV